MNQLDICSLPRCHKCFAIFLFYGYFLKLFTDSENFLMFQLDENYFELVSCGDYKCYACSPGM